MDQQKIGRCILDLRKQEKLTQAELADRLGVTAQAVSKWENGRGMPDIALLKKISEEFHVDLTGLLEGSLVRTAAKPRLSKKTIYFWWGLAALAVITASILFFRGAGTRQNGYAFSSLSSNNSSFSIKGAAAYTASRKSIYITDIRYEGKTDTAEYTDISCSLYESGGSSDTLLARADAAADQLPSTLAQFLKTVEFNVSNDDPGCKVLTENSLFLLIDARDSSGSLNTYKIPVTLDSGCE